MNLELKHLAPYLPYGLKWTCPFGGQDRMTGIITDNIIIDSNGTEINDSIDLTYTKGNRSKPILRPLSDLNKKIQKAEFYMSFYDHLERINPSTYKTQNCALMLDGAIEMQYYNDYQFLFEHHFDVFGLIEKGLAIDINTIN